MPSPNDLAAEQTRETRLYFVLGLFCLLVWPALFLFNCTLLAQVMELFVPPGAVPVVLPLVGWEIDPMALVFAVILSVCQAIFVLFFDITKGWGKVASGYLMVSAVAIEIGGAYMRAKVIGEGMASGGILTGLTAGGAALIGAMGPLSVMIATWLAMRYVVVPILTLPGSLSQRIKLLNQ